MTAKEKKLPSSPFCDSLKLKFQIMCLIGRAWVTFLYLICKEGQKGKYLVINLLEKETHFVLY